MIFIYTRPHKYFIHFFSLSKNYNIRVEKCVYYCNGYFIRLTVYANINCNIKINLNVIFYRHVNIMLQYF